MNTERSSRASFFASFMSFISERHSCWRVCILVSTSLLMPSRSTSAVMVGHFFVGVA